MKIFLELQFPSSAIISKCKRQLQNSSFPFSVCIQLVNSLWMKRESTKYFILKSIAKLFKVMLLIPDNHKSELFCINKRISRSFRYFSSKSVGLRFKYNYIRLAASAALTWQEDIDLAFFPSRFQSRGFYKKKSQHHVSRTRLPLKASLIININKIPVVFLQICHRRRNENEGRHQEDFSVRTSDVLPANTARN